MNYIDQIASHDFSKMLTLLVTGQKDFLEYGEVGNVGGMFSYLRIRYIATGSGMQFAIKLLHSGVEGSGEYFLPDLQITQMKLRLAVLIHKYEEPNPLLDRMRQHLAKQGKPLPQRRPVQCEFFTGHDEDTRTYAEAVSEVLSPDNLTGEQP